MKAFFYEDSMDECVERQSSALNHFVRLTTPVLNRPTSQYTVNWR